MSNTGYFAWGLTFPEFLGLILQEYAQMNTGYCNNVHSWLCFTFNA